jgi:hypothetical protein
MFKPYEGRFLTGPPLTPQTLPARFTAHHKVGGDWPDPITSYHQENTSEKPGNPLNVVLEIEPSLVTSSLAAPFLPTVGFEPTTSGCSPISAALP